MELGQQFGEQLTKHGTLCYEQLNKLGILCCQFSVPQIEYPLGGSKKGSDVYFLLIVAMVVLLWCQIILLWHHVTMVASEQHLYQTIVQFDQTIVLSRKLATGSIHDYLFCYYPLMGILFGVLKIVLAAPGVTVICVHLSLLW